MGSIDCDPASSDIAQKTVKAAIYYTIDNNGLNFDWSGNVWLNPPYSHPEVEKFTSKAVNHYNSVQINAIILVNNATDTKWFHEMLDSCSAICLTKGRINFIDDTGKQGLAPRQGQVFLYFGNDAFLFQEEFSQYGKVLHV